MQDTYQLQSAYYIFAFQRIVFFLALIEPDVAVNTSGKHIFLCFVSDEKMLLIPAKCQLMFLTLLRALGWWILINHRMKSECSGLLEPNLTDQAFTLLYVEFLREFIILSSFQQYWMKCLLSNIANVMPGVNFEHVSHLN